MLLVAAMCTPLALWALLVLAAAIERRLDLADQAPAPVARPAVAAARGDNARGENARGENALLRGTVTPVPGRRRPEQGLEAPESHVLA